MKPINTDSKPSGAARRNLYGAAASAKAHGKGKRNPLQVSAEATVFGYQGNHQLVHVEGGRGGDAGCLQAKELTIATKRANVDCWTSRAHFSSRPPPHDSRSSSSQVFLKNLNLLRAASSLPAELAGFLNLPLRRVIIDFLRFNCTRAFRVVSRRLCSRVWKGDAGWRRLGV